MMSIVAEFNMIKEQMDDPCDTDDNSESDFKKSLQCLVTGASFGGKLDNDENMAIAEIFGWLDCWNRKLLTQSER